MRRPKMLRPPEGGRGTITRSRVLYFLPRLVVFFFAAGFLVAFFFVAFFFAAIRCSLLGTSIRS